MAHSDAEVFEMASGGLSIWVDSGIHLKLNVAHIDPVKLGEEEALQLGRLLLRLVDEQRTTCELFDFDACGFDPCAFFR